MNVVVLGPGGNNVHNIRTTDAVNNTRGEPFKYFLFSKSNVYVADALFSYTIKAYNLYWSYSKNAKCCPSRFVKSPGQSAE